MNIKRIYIESKKSKNFQTYTVGLDIEIPEGTSEEDTDMLILRAQGKCRQAAVQQFKYD